MNALCVQVSPIYYMGLTVMTILLLDLNLVNDPNWEFGDRYENRGIVSRVTLERVCVQTSTGNERIW